MLRYRIRVGKGTLAGPHYVTKVGDSPNYSSLAINRNPCSWKKLAIAKKHLTTLQKQYLTAEIEEYNAQ